MPINKFMSSHHLTIMLFLVGDKECTIGNYRNYDSSSETVNCPTLTLVGLNDSNIQFKPLSLSFSNWTDFEFDDETGFSSSCPYRWKSKNGKLAPPSLSLFLSYSSLPPSSLIWRSSVGLLAFCLC